MPWRLSSPMCGASLGTSRLLSIAQPRGFHASCLRRPFRFIISNSLLSCWVFSRSTYGDAVKRHGGESTRGGAPTHICTPSPPFTAVRKKMRLCLPGLKST
jgi:hypothetical protein